MEDLAVDELSFFEKLENVYVLKETREMLLNKLSITSEDSVLFPVITNDLKKIENELASYTNGTTDNFASDNTLLIPDPDKAIDE